MHIVTLRLKNVRSFCLEPAGVDLADLAFVLGPNGAENTTCCVWRHYRRQAPGADAGRS